MQIRMLTSMAGENFSYSPGELVQVTPETGVAWIAAGIAGPAEPTPVEIRVTAPAKTTARRRK